MYSKLFFVFLLVNCIKFMEVIRSQIQASTVLIVLLIICNNFFYKQFFYERFCLTNSFYLKDIFPNIFTAIVFFLNFYPTKFLRTFNLYESKCQLFQKYQTNLLRGSLNYVF